MRESPAQRARTIVTMCREAGFALAGAAALRPPTYGAALRDWLSAGKHGEMGWIADTLAERLDPTRLLPGARSAVMVGDLYAARGVEPDGTAPAAGRIARYARGRDYHSVLRRRVQAVCDRVRAEYAEAQTRPFCDTAPVLERDLAALCGLGWIGKHTLLIHPVHGSWMVLGGFLTTLELEAPPEQSTVGDHCGTCTRCIDACPTEAITPHSVDARRCISYLTIEHRSRIDPALGERIGDWLIGCDVCQEVCPHNSARPHDRGLGPRPEYEPRRRSFDLLEVLGWDEQTRRGRFATSAMKRVSLAQVKRNAITVMAGLLRGEEGGGLSPEDREKLRVRLRDLSWDAREPAEVRDAARDVLGDRIS